MCVLQHNKIRSNFPKKPNTGRHVGGDDNEKGAKMGEAAGKKHVLLRRTSDDGPAERSLLPDHVPHHRDLLALLRFRVSPPTPPRSKSRT